MKDRTGGKKNQPVNVENSKSKNEWIGMKRKSKPSTEPYVPLYTTTIHSQPSTLNIHPKVCSRCITVSDHHLQLPQEFQAKPFPCLSCGNRNGNRHRVTREHFKNSMQESVGKGSKREGKSGQNRRHGRIRTGGPFCDMRVMQIVEARGPGRA